MSIGFRAVQWNRDKLIYDAVVIAGIAIYMAAFVLIARHLHPPKDRPADIDIWIRAYGSCAFLMLTVILSIGPLARLDRRFLPLLYNRRHFGVMTFLMALMHAWLMVLWFTVQNALPDLITEMTSWANYGKFIGFPFKALGLGAVLVLFLMAATSHDFWLVFLTPRIWKSLHMTIYIAYGLVAMHVALGIMLYERTLLIPLMLFGERQHGDAAASRSPAGESAGLIAAWHSLETAGLRSARRATFRTAQHSIVCAPGGERIAVFRDGDEIGALTNLCAHQNGPLGEGRIVDGCVTCPWHGYQYRLADGCAPPPFAEKLDHVPREDQPRVGRGRSAAVAIWHPRFNQTSVKRGTPMAEQHWIDIGLAEELSRAPLRRVKAGDRELAVSFKDGRFGAVSNACNHVGGPLGEGRLDGEYITCPWHNWKFHRCTGKGEPGFEEDAVPAYAVKVEGGRVLVDMASATKRTRKPHPPHPLARKIERAPGPIRVAGISTSPMDEANPRFSGSDHLLRHALNACAAHGAESKLIRLSELKFRACEGYYSKVGARLHLALLDHADGRQRPARPRLRGAGALGRRHHRRHADPLGRGVIALFQDGRAAELRAELDHHPQSGADPQQGRGLHHCRRPGQHPGRRRPDARLLRRARLHLPAVSLRRALARLVERGHGAQRRDRPRVGGTGRRRRDAGQALHRSRREPDCARPSADLDRARRPQSPSRWRWKRRISAFRLF